VSSHQWNSPCADGQRDADLCNLASVQAKIGLIAQAQATADNISNPELRVKAWLAIAAAQINARQSFEARQTFARCLQLAQTLEAPGALHESIGAYADWIRSTPAERSALPELQRIARSMPDDPSGDLPGYYIDTALRALAGAHASAGDFTAAFEIAEKLIRTDRAGAYIEIFDAAS
jgi:tetratricopeptide (TPR) repeat protein